MNEADIILERRKTNRAKNIFIKVLDYFVFCYNLILENKDTISEAECAQNTKFDFEYFIKEHLVTKYLQNKNVKLSFRHSEIKNLLFEQEPAKSYIENGIKRRDLVDICVLNLELDWLNVNKENQYFAFECKRLKNKSKNNEYITDIQKFVNREYEFRFPFTGMIGFIEKSKIDIPDIIADIDSKIKTHKHIKSKVLNDKVLIPFQMTDFEYCRTSNHEHKTNNKNIEVYHLFFNYTNIIVE